MFSAVSVFKVSHGTFNGVVVSVRVTCITTAFTHHCWVTFYLPCLCPCLFHNRTAKAAFSFWRYALRSCWCLQHITLFFSFVRLLAEVLLLLKCNTFFISRLNHLCAHHPPFPGFMTNFCLLVWYKRHEVISQDTGANMLPFLGTQYDAQVIQNTFHFLFVWCCFSFVLLLIKPGILILDYIVPVTSGLHGKITD